MTRRLVAAAALLTSFAVHAGKDVFLQAVNFALTGDDDLTVKVIDRSNCIFQVGQDIYYLNNVHVDRITMRAWQTSDALNNAIHQYVAVELHGADSIFETTVPAIKDLSEDPQLPAIMKEKIKADREAHPEQYVDHQSKSNEHKLTLATSEKARLERAWKYIYSRGCHGAKSSF